jgi:hypothetical protein
MASCCPSTTHTQPLFEAFEEGLNEWAPKLLETGSATLLTTRLVYRSINTVIITIIAATVPYFSLFGGLIGALSFWPLAVIYPILMHRTVHPPSPRRAMLMDVTNYFMLCVCILATLGSFYAFTQVG